jgi:glutamine---fructose-6-phosphate transaminase (isomerizing)
LVPEARVPDSFTVIEGRYLRDILDQPKALEDTLAGLQSAKPLVALARSLSRNKFQRIILTGMGSSFHALHPLNLELIAHGFTPVMVETGELVHHQKNFFDRKTLIVAVSQSGLSAETIRLMQANRKRSPLIAITNTPDSPLARNAAATVVTKAGDEFSVSCKTYVSTLLALEWLGAILCQRNLRGTLRELSAAALGVAAYLADWKDHVESLAAALDRVRHLFLVGRGASLAAVGAGALIVKESSHFHAEGMTSAAFRHGPIEMLSAETLVLVFSGQGESQALNRRLVADLQQLDGRAELVGKDATRKCFQLPRAGAGVHSIIEILPVQMITLALAARNGREAGQFDRATKVTITE